MSKGQSGLSDTCPRDEQSGLSDTGPRDEQSDFSDTGPKDEEAGLQSSLKPIIRKSSVGHQI